MAWITRQDYIEGMLWTRCKWIFARILPVLVAYSLTRVTFILWNHLNFANQSWSSLFQVMLGGLRFDLATICLSNLLLILLALVPGPWPGRNFYQVGMKVLYVFINSVGVGLNLIDVEMVNFTGRRMSWDLLSLQQDIQDQGLSLLLTYWPLLLLWLSLSYWFWRAYRPLPIAPPGAWRWKLLESLSVILLVFVGARGGWQLKPLRPVHAFSLGSNELGVATLNSLFTMLKSKGSANLERRRYYASDLEALSELRARQKPSAWRGKFKSQNIVVIILESFGQEYIGSFNEGKGYTPFLDELMQKSLVFPNSFSNGRRSIEAMPSILVGIPALTGEPFITSNFLSNRIVGLPEILRKQGYATSFFHAAKNGSMFFDSFSARIGVDRYLGRNEYPKPQDDDGQWGIFDEPFLQFMVTELNQTPQPFFSTVFTLSSHHPYKIPKSLETQFPKGSLPIHQSISYTDYSLRKFFEAAKQQSWFPETLFVITADHTQLTEDVRYQDQLGYFRVPILFYQEGRDWSGVDRTRVAQHADLPASLLDLLGIEAPQLPFGSSLFAEGPGVVINASAAGPWVYDGVVRLESLVALGQFRCEQVLGRGRSEVLEQGDFKHPPQRADCLRAWHLLRASEQVFVNGLLDNKWF